MTRLFLLFVMLISPRLESASLDSARLFDWYYPSESAYQELYEASKAARSKSWLLPRMQNSQPLPQASARELALDLIADPKTPENVKARLKARFAPEPASVLAGRSNQEANISELEMAFSKLNEKMNDLETTMKNNNFNKQTFPSVSSSIRAAAFNAGGSGIFTAQSRGYLMGGAGVNFDGQNDAGGFSFGIDVGFDPNFTLQGSGEKAPVAIQHGQVSTGSASFQMGYKSFTFGATLGGGDSMKESALVLGAAPGSGAPTAFYVNQEIGSNKPVYFQNDLKLGLPWGNEGRWSPNMMYLKKQGTNEYWPFNNFILFYALEDGFNKTYNTNKVNIWGTSIHKDMGSLWGLVDNNLMNATIVGAGNDKSELRGYGLVDAPKGNIAWSLHDEILFSWAGKLEVEYGQSVNFQTDTTYTFTNTSGLEGYTGGPVKGYERRFSGEGYVAAYTHPLGVVTLGLEYERLSPLFTPAQGAVNSMIINGVDSDAIANQYNAATITPWFKPPPPAGHMEKGKAIIDKPQDFAWGTNVSAATGMMSNTNKEVLQLQVAWSWISLGLFGGVASQIEASGPWLKTQPSLESGQGGYMLWDRLGGGYWLPPFPNTAAPPRTNVANMASNQYSLWSFNSPADGMAVYDNTGSKYGVHWNAITQIEYQKIDYYVLFSKRGVGDDRLDGFSQKFINYAAGSMKFDLQSLLGRVLPFELNLYGSTSDVSLTPGLPRFGEPGKAGDADMLYFSQSFVSAFSRFGLTQSLTLVGLLAHEEWKSNHSFFPISTGLTEYGAGFDIDLSKTLSGLSIFVRSRIMNFEDYNIGKRAFSIWESSLGTNLSF